MDPKQSHELNQAAFRKLKPTIDKTYPPGRFVALYGGEVIGDAATFQELHDSLTARGFVDPEEVLVLQAGVEYPEFAYILLEDGAR
jgi:hypothetical protein